MKKTAALLACLLAFELQALDYEKQFENDQVCVAKVTVQPHEEIGLHRDVYPQVVVALKGGTITRLEADGKTVDVHFPTGVAVFRESDPENELHKSVNNSDQPVELVITQLKNSSPARQEKNAAHNIAVEVELNCPASEEFAAFVQSIPKPESQSANFEQWKTSFVTSMNRLIQLVESEKVANSSWSAKIDDRYPH